MFFTQYNSVLFLLTIAMSLFAISLIAFTKLREKKAVRSISYILSVLTLLGLLKYRITTAKDFHVYDSFLLAITESCIVAAITIRFLKNRLVHQKNTLNLALILYITTSLTSFLLSVYLFPGDVNEYIHFFYMLSITWFFLLLLVIRKRILVGFPLPTQLVLFLSIYTAFVDLTILSFSLFSIKLSFFKTDIIVYFICYWRLIISYFKPKIPIPQFQTDKKPDESLPEAIIQECLGSLKVAIEEKKLYLDPELTLQSLAAEINMSSRTISTVLNTCLQKNFRDYLNGYRVEEAKRLLTDYKARNETIAAVSYDAGFNSLATFQRVFKNVVGKTPKEFAEK